MKAKLSFSIVLGLLLTASPLWGGEFSNPFKRKPPQETQQPAPIAERAQPREVAPSRVAPVQPPPAQRQEDQPSLQPPPDNIDTIDESHPDAADIADGNEGPYKLKPEPVYVVDKVLSGTCYEKSYVTFYAGGSAYPPFPSCNDNDKVLEFMMRKDNGWKEIKEIVTEGIILEMLLKDAVPSGPCIAHLLRYCQPVN